MEEVLKALPGTDCGDCGVATCAEFARSLAERRAQHTACPHFTPSARKSLNGLVPADANQEIADEASFERFAKNTELNALKFLLSKGLTKEDAEDLQQEAYLICWCRRHDARHPKTFLHGILRRLLQAHWRKQRHLPTVSLEELDSEPVILPEIEKTELLDVPLQVATLLDILPPRQRQVIEMQWIKGMEDKQIAEELGITGITVRRNRMEALARLRE